MPLRARDPSLEGQPLGHFDGICVLSVDLRSMASAALSVHCGGEKSLWQAIRMLVVLQARGANVTARPWE